MPSIEISKPSKIGHPLAQAPVLEQVKLKAYPQQEMIRLVDYLKDVAAKPRGSAAGGKEDLNSHNEEFIIGDSQGIRLSSLPELQSLLKSQGVNVEILGVQSIGNANQKIEAMVQGLDRNKPKSGFERPTATEGPHMILAPPAIDNKGQLHVFRTIQMRTGKAMIDVPRGFADTKSLRDGTQMYDVENSAARVNANMKRVVGEESGDALQIKRVTFLGAPRVNSSFVLSQSAIFAVEVDYNQFIKNQKVVTPEELQRRQRVFEHEGLTGDILDMTLDQYANYKMDSQLSKDMAADFGTDTVVIDFVMNKLEEQKTALEKKRKQLKDIGEANTKFKQEDPQGYVKQMLRQSGVKHPENFEENKRKAEEYLRKFSGKP